MNETPKQKALLELLNYDADTGFLSWEDTGKCAVHIKNDGYAYVSFHGKRFLAHRVIWAIHYGRWPTTPLDHKNMIKSDNRITNLRLSSVSENNRNRPKQSNNTSGYKGVTWHKQTKKYHAKIMHNKQRVSLGYFDNPIDASIAYQQAAKEFHHDFARS